jgi:hypothetical protein
VSNTPHHGHHLAFPPFLSLKYLGPSLFPSKSDAAQPSGDEANRARNNRRSMSGCSVIAFRVARVATWGMLFLRVFQFPRGEEMDGMLCSSVGDDARASDHAHSLERV